MTATLRTRRVRLALEELEPRLVPSAGPTAYEEQMLEQLNAIRANPAAYGASIGLDLSNVAPSQPLAFNQGLINAAEAHSLDMSVNNYFSHTAPNGSDPGQRMSAAGVQWLSYGESIAAGYATTATALQGLIIDAGEPDLGHRIQLLAMTSMFQGQQQVGIGVTLNGTGNYSDYYTIDTTVLADTRPYLTGAVFNDANNNGQYDVGEGLGGVTLTIAGVGSMTTWASGGYSWQLSPGTYTVTASGPGLAMPVTKTVTLGTTNVELNFLAPAVSAVSVAADSAWVATEYQSLLHRNAGQQEVAYWTNVLMQGVSQPTVVAEMEATPEFVQGNTAWVKSLYQSVLGRPADPVEASAWVQQLQAGLPPANVVTAIQSSAATQDVQWQAWIGQGYQSLLKRTPNASEVAFWLNGFQTGLTEATFTAALAGSPEFAAQQVGSNTATWITNVYSNLLQRAAATSEINYWTGVLQRGASRQTVVELIAQSNEYQQLQNRAFVQGLYLTLLNRPANSADVAYWMAVLANGTSWNATIQTFLLSNEFYNRAQSM